MAMHIAKGITLKLATNTIGKVTSIGGLEISADEEETTSICDSSGYRSFMPTFRDGGNVPIEGLYDDTASENFDKIAALKESDTASAFEIGYPGGIKWSGNCYLSKFKFGEAAVGNLLKWSAELRIIGQPTLTLPTAGGGGQGSP